MKSFKEFRLLVEGGNVSVGGVSAQPIDIHKHGRGNAIKDIYTSMSALHDSFHAEHGIHLFGENKKALETGSAYSGSTKHLMNSKEIKDDEFMKHKATVGDVDVQVPKEHMAHLHGHLAPGKKFGKFTVVGTKKHGGEISAVMRHENGNHHQVDFEGVDYSGHEPSEFERFAHSSDWHDTKNGVKGVHHKQLLNAAGGTTHKFSITHGLRSRDDEKDQPDKNIKSISSRLFGAAADHKSMHSFHGVTQLIKHHISPDKHQEIYDKMKDSGSKGKVDNSAALAHLRKHLKVRDSLNESSDGDVHHTTVVPLTGFTPHSHMGHAQDLGSTMDKLPGTKHVGISGKSDAYSHDERKKILERQWGKGTNAHVVSGAGETIARAHDSLPKHGKKVLHLLVGHDRKSLAEGLKKSLEGGKIKEMGDRKFDEIYIHHPEDSDRSHGMSGTKMRQVAHEGNVDEYHRHLGPMFSRLEAKTHMKRIQAGIKNGSIPLKR